MTQRGDPRPSGAGRSGDDFRKIDGVGRRFEQRLWDAGIFTYRDLAQRTPDEIAAVLAPMAGISPERIVSQARELAGSPPEASVPRQHYAAFHVEFLLESDNSVRRTKVRQHQTDARDAWSGWDEERLLSFLRDRIPLPAAATPADASGVEPAQAEITDQEPASAEPAPAGQVSAPAPDRLPSWTLSIEELTPIRDGQRSNVLGSSESTSVRLTMRINPTGPPIHDTFDFSATVAARRFAGHDRSPLGTSHGTIRVSDPISVEVTGPAMPADLYRLVVAVDIYPADHSQEEPPLYQKRASGDLMRVVDVSLGSATAMA
jgi:predicted flap endonuclease-1-like 5' DNA nuclease